MTLDPAQLPDDIATLKTMLIAADKRASEHNAEVENLKLTSGVENAVCEDAT